MSPPARHVLSPQTQETPVSSCCKQKDKTGFCYNFPDANIRATDTKTGRLLLTVRRAAIAPGG